MSQAQDLDTQLLAAALRERGHRAEAFYAEPPNTRVAGLNVWYDTNDDRPTTCVWAPFSGDGWVWGDNFEYTAPTDTPTRELADRVSTTLTPRA